VKYLKTLTDFQIRDLRPESLDKLIAAIRYESTKNIYMLDLPRLHSTAVFQAPPSMAAVKAKEAEEDRIRAELLDAVRIAEAKVERKAKKTASIASSKLC
jgi:hypothetical protein